jgi:hypothetical protein
MPRADTVFCDRGHDVTHGPFRGASFFVELLTFNERLADTIFYVLYDKIHVVVAKRGSAAQKPLLLKRNVKVRHG